jgi:hypothetical protein
MLHTLVFCVNSLVITVPSVEHPVVREPSQYVQKEAIESQYMLPYIMLPVLPFAYGNESEKPSYRARFLRQLLIDDILEFL